MEREHQVKVRLFQEIGLFLDRVHISRYFVMALRDFYQEGGESSDTSAPKNDQGNADDWALTYLTVSRLQSISEVCEFLCVSQTSPDVSRHSMTMRLAS